MSSKKRIRNSAEAAGATAVGAGAGYAAVEVAGFSALGLVGEGAGIGCAAGPAGAAAGAVLGLAAYGLYRILSD